MKRIAIILDKNLEPGAAANVAALLMGQASLNEPELYSSQPVLDQSGVQHAGIQYSTVILKAGENQLINLVKSCSEHDGGLNFLVFSQTGRSLNNAFEQYASEIANMALEATKVVGVIIWGEDEAVRAMTKKFSVMR
ncbi:MULTISPECIES: DUF2000 family protein [unclassified Paenibacillus]|uniref:DUF2000 family protein n=1 Tax=unclassified Paenibacillus TaxID=185978 RepID=UPI001F2DA6D1|nr:DUF2000 family protein [Paenibacillus sp. JJ-223]CAH1208685.1 hypothetical protein PAECIP111890_03148 [Paenibacillus sp. JJ-223]